MARSVCISALGPAPFERRDGATISQTISLAKTHLETWIEKVLPDKPDLIVLPEACDRPKNMGRAEGRRYVAERGTQIRDWLCALAREQRVNVAYSACLPEKDGSARNATTFIGRGGEIRGVYHKNHLVWEEESESGIRFGREAPIIEMDFGRAAGVICFDLNFDELREKYVRAKPELLVFSSMYHGGFVQRNWAYTCRSYFVGAVAGLPCTIIDPLGEVVAQSTNYHPYVTQTVNLDYVLAHLDYNWEKLDAMRRHYGPLVRVKDPGLLGAVMITSESDTVSASKMAAEFEIELLDDYMERSLAHRHAPGMMEEDRDAEN